MKTNCLYKILLIGNTSVGKSSLLINYIDKKFMISGLHTIGIDFKSKVIVINNIPITLQIWDTAGQERFKSLSKQYYRGGHAAIFVFDITERESFENIEYWINAVKNEEKNILMILVGNKVDKENERKVSYEEAKNYADKLGIMYAETSAMYNNIITKNGDGIFSINQIFNQIGASLVQKSKIFIDSDNKSKISTDQRSNNKFTREQLNIIEQREIEKIRKNGRPSISLNTEPIPTLKESCCN